MSIVADQTVPAGPDARGRFGDYGGRYVPEVLIPALDELAAAWTELRDDPGFRDELGALLARLRRPTRRRSRARPACPTELGYDIWLKREDLAHTGAHKINNALGQALIAKRLGKERIIAETGAGQHGVAAATACALLGLPCVVYMGEEDTHRQAPNVARMKLLGAEVVPVTAGTAHPEGSRERGAARLGGHASRTPTTSSARSSGRTRSRSSCATCSG